MVKLKNFFKFLVSRYLSNKGLFAAFCFVFGFGQLIKINFKINLVCSKRAGP